MINMQDSKTILRKLNNVEEAMCQRALIHSNYPRCSVIYLTPAIIGLQLAKSVSFIGESLIKSLGNVFLCLFLKKCSFSKGVLQLFISAPLGVLLTAAYLISAPIQLIAIPIITAIDPTLTCSIYGNYVLAV